MLQQPVETAIGFAMILTAGQWLASYGVFDVGCDQPSEYRLTIYRYAIIVSFSKYR